MIIKISPDKEKAKSMMRLAENRINFIRSITDPEFATIIAENYYEIIKELASAILLLDGFKAIGEFAHKELFEKLSEYNEIEGFEINLMNDLRIKRNKSCYEGKKIEYSYIENKSKDLKKIIKKLKEMLNKKMK
ncbi:hypothetical protein B6U93_02415 [Candidatus Woesearchaeota archaeon ex4484_78]|nr:MAG: hypothetical protein B6U93_02415 [Candidatus Woesearchaeota archaeon ex4484_78]